MIITANVILCSATKKFASRALSTGGETLVSLHVAPSQ